MSMSTRELDRRASHFNSLMERMAEAVASLDAAFYAASLTMKMLKGDDQGMPMRPCHVIGVKVTKSEGEHVAGAMTFSCVSGDEKVSLTGWGVSEAEAMRDFDEKWWRMVEGAEFT